MTRHYQDQGAASDWSYHVISVEFLRSFLIRHFAAKLMVVLRNVGCFSACTIRIVSIHILILSEFVLRSRFFKITSCFLITFTFD